MTRPHGDFSFTTATAPSPDEGTTTRRLTLLTLLASTACAVGESRDEGFATRDSVGILIAENAFPAWQVGEAWQLAPEPSLRIGVVDGPAEMQLFRVNGSRRLEDGSIVVSNAGTHQIRRYDPNGAFLWTAGGEGDGPGEFRSMGTLALLPGDSIAAFDPQQVRMTIFGPDGQLGRVVTLPRSQRSGQHFPIGITADGSVIVRLGWSSANDPPDVQTGRRRIQDVLLRYDLGAGTVDTLGTFPGSEQLTVVTANSRFSLGSPPFGWGRFDALRSDELLMAYTERFEVQVLDMGGSVRQILRAAVQPEPVTQQHIDDYMERVRTSLRENPTANETSRRLTELRLEAVTFPPTHPMLDRMLVDRTGNVWLRHARRVPADPEASPGPFQWSVFNPEGRWLGSLPIPERFVPLDIGEDYVLGVTTDELDVEYLHVYQLEKP